MVAGLAGLVGPGLAQLGTNVGGATVAGGITGWATKKLVKVVAVLVGLELALFAYLANQGVITVHWSQLGAAFSGWTAIQLPTWVTSGLAATGIGLGFAGGFAYGFHRG